MQPPPIKDYALNNIVVGETNSREQETPTRGNYFYVLEATHSNFSLQINDGPKLRGKLARGHRFPDDFEIEKIRVYNESGTSQPLSIVFQVGKGEPLDNVFNVSSDTTTPLTDSQLRASAVSVSDASALNLNSKIGSPGQALASGSTPVVLPLDQSMLATLGATPVVTSYPASQSLTGTGTIQFGVQPGAALIVTLTNAVASTAAFVGTIGFQTSTDGTTWVPVNAMPQTIPGASAVNVTSTTAAGLWIVNVPVNHRFFRFNCTAYTSGTIWGFVEPWGKPNAVCLLPFTYSVTSGNSITNWIDASGFSEIDITLSAVTTTVLTVQGTNDPTGADVRALPVQDANSSTTTGATTITAAGAYRINPFGYKWVRVQVTTTGTVLTIQGISAKIGQSVSLTSLGNSVFVNTNNASVSLAQIAGQTAISTTANGSTNRALAAVQTTAISQVDQSATAFAGNGRVNGTVVASAAGSGAYISSEINVTALNLGTATSVVFILQESRGGTNFTDIWYSEPITATGIVSIPAIPVAGRRRWACHSVGGTSTTVTATVTTLELPSGYIHSRYGRDVYAATNSMASVINNVTQTSSTFGAATSLAATTQSTTAFLVEGCSNLTATVVLGGSPTVTTQPVISLEISNNLTDWFTTSANITGAGNGVYQAVLTGRPARFARLRVTTAAAYSAGSYTVSGVSIYGVD
jgi:hypothetical protein